jgi:hypothetical protein
MEKLVVPCVVFLFLLSQNAKLLGRFQKHNKCIPNSTLMCHVCSSVGHSFLYIS